MELMEKTVTVALADLQDPSRPYALCKSPSRAARIATQSEEGWEPVPDMPIWWSCELGANTYHSIEELDYGIVNTYFKKGISWDKGLYCQDGKQIINGYYGLVRFSLVGDDNTKRRKNNISLHIHPPGGFEHMLSSRKPVMIKLPNFRDAKKIVSNLFNPGLLCVGPYDAHPLIKMLLSILRDEYTKLDRGPYLCY